ncbi:DAK2 domain-containing protein [Phycicoccus sp. BSK3Z-2]|uniref:DAK2 domain-containing protein n=1 Tax=Phycicoccus avicenniae TaxID=2828860 RepID=A0A941D6W5_9MICO|nr:DAK2 domain-containing protein [Phycicoccus avicenniae]MBR7742813.1 DAK2 domain-containing protein [Phycicoccus avicenniae]
MPDVLTADDARHWALLTRAALAARRTELDDLNVFPVPDGDTGTNLYLTLDGALETVADSLGATAPADLVEECRRLRRAILVSARGNSGVILSQVVGGLCDVVEERQARTVDAALLAVCLVRGAAAARAGVGHPREGTILTVADAAAAAARKTADAGGGLAEVSAAAVTAARGALAGTPDQLAELADAGVVDAGGAGCLLLLESLHRVVTGAWTQDDPGTLDPARVGDRDEWHRPATSGAREPEARNHGASAGDALAEPDHLPAHGGPAYEVMYLLTVTDAGAVDVLRARLDALGDSLLVVGGPRLWNVHVHVDDPGAAVEAGIAAGVPERIRITHLPSQVAGRAAGGRVGVVVGSPGPGVASLVEEAGGVPVDLGADRPGASGRVLAAARATGAREVVVLPGDPAGLEAAEVAARAAGDEGLALHVVPAVAVVQSLAALAVLDPARTVGEVVDAMTSAAGSSRYGAVTPSADGVVGTALGEVVPTGAGAEVAARAVLERLLSAGGELVTLVAGSGAGRGLADRVADALSRERPGVEVVVLDGGQPDSLLLLGVE